MGIEVGVMKIGLIDVDSKIPNLALMKVSAYHKTQGDTVEWYDPMFGDKPDVIYASKIFTFTPDYQYFPSSEDIVIHKGGTGYDIDLQLPPEIDSMCPDYSLYPNMDYSLGFLTRGCPNKCPWCFVPHKEGGIKPYADIEDFCRHKQAVLMDNNVLASEWGIKQIEKIIGLGIRVDFNQGLDARLIDDSVAKLLSRVKWLKPVRLACDTEGQMKYVQRAVEALRWYNTKPMAYSCYVLLRPGEIDDAIKRIRFLKGIGVDPFVQPYQPPEGREIPKQEKDLARYCDHKAVFKSVWWEEYQTGKRGII
jgi:hypothetical protein